MSAKTKNTGGKKRRRTRSPEAEEQMRQEREERKRTNGAAPPVLARDPAIEMRDALTTGFPLPIAAEHFPVLKLTNSGIRQNQGPVPLANLRYLLKRFKLTLRFDVMEWKWKVTGIDVPNDPHTQNKVRQILMDTFRACDFSVDRTHIDTLLDLVAWDDQFHPMEDWITSKAWDGQPRIERLAATVPTDTAAWPMYLRKWLIQGVESVRGWRSGAERSLPHVGVFQGGQGAGKGRWIRSLVPDGWVLADHKLHLSSYNEKDDTIAAFSRPIVELGEIDATFKKSDVEDLKKLLSRPVDMIRPPYGREPVKRARMTTFFGSVNRLEFLNDPTGARRFWPVRVVGSLDWDHGIDMQQVWAEANVRWEGGEDWNLDAETEAQRVEGMEAFTFTNPEVDLVEAHYAHHKHEFGHYMALNKSEIARLLNLPTTRPVLDSLTDWLRSTLGPERKIGGRYGRTRVWAFPLSPHLMKPVGRAYMDPDEAERYAAMAPRFGGA